MNWGWIVITAIWTVGGWFAMKPPHPINPDLDFRRCYALHQQVYCWPKDGCFLASNGDAVCWRVVKVKPR